MLVDEVEYALEPYRVRRLVRELLVPSSKTEDERKGENEASPTPRTGVVLMTSHSPIVLGELKYDHLRIVRTKEGVTQILRPKSEVQPLFRTNPEAFLSRKIVVCEGMTELGLLRGLDETWAKTGKPFAVEGVALADGRGSTTVGGVARAFRELGYQTAVLADSDQPLDVPCEELEKEGIFVALWSETTATEQRIFLDLPWEGVKAAVKLAITEHGEDLVRRQLATTMKISPNDIPSDIEDWSGIGTELELRRALGDTAKSKKSGWFKRVDRAFPLGELVANYIDRIEETDLARKIRAVLRWVFNA